MDCITAGKNFLRHNSDDSKVVKENSTKAIFFLRHNNDIDHITPVLYKWLSTKDVPTDVIITTKRSLLDDYRIEFLKKYKNVNIFYINDLFKKYSLAHIFNIFYFKYTTELDNVFKKHPMIKSVASKIIRDIANHIFKGVNKGVVVFDWTTTFFVRQIIKSAKNKGFATVSLPHGDRVYMSQLETKNDLNYDCLISNKSSKIFDFVVVPNDLCVKRYDKWLKKDRIKVLGSARYSDEWRNIISEYIPVFEREKSRNKLKIVFFLRNTGFPINWEEVIRTIKLLVQFPEVYLIVRHHPRNSSAKKMTRQLIKLFPDVKHNICQNLEFIYGDVNSVSLINWADIVIDLGTSITWEAIKLGKPTLIPEYLNANYTLIAYYMPESDMRCRDDLYHTIEDFIKDKNRKFLKEEDRKKFIKEMIDVPDGNILERYVSFLEMCLDESSKK